MLKRIFFVVILLFGFSDAFSQAMLGVKFAKKEKSNKVVNIEFETRQQQFDNLNRDGSVLRTALERRFIQKGDSVRIKYSFDPRMIKHIEVEDAAPATPKDISSGEFIAVSRPEKTKVIRARIHIKDEFGGSYISENRIVVVLDKAEFEKLDAELKKYEANKDVDGIAKINAKVNEYIKAAGIDAEKAKHQIN